LGLINLQIPLRCAQHAPGLFTFGIGVSTIKFMDFINSTTNKTIKLFKILKGKYKFFFSLLENNLFQRWTIGIVLCLILALILAPEINFSAPKLKQGMIAAHDIKADRDFLVEDQLSTKQKKNDAAENIKPVYDFDSNIAIAIKNKLLKSIASVDEYYQRLPKEKVTENNSLNIRENKKAKTIYFGQVRGVYRGFN